MEVELLSRQEVEGLSRQAELLSRQVELLEQIWQKMMKNYLSGIDWEFFWGFLLGQKLYLWNYLVSGPSFAICHISYEFKLL